MRGCLCYILSKYMLSRFLMHLSLQQIYEQTFIVFPNRISRPLCSSVNYICCPGTMYVDRLFL